MLAVALQENILALDLEALQVLGCLLHLVDVGDELPLLVRRSVGEGVLDVPDKVLDFRVIDEKGPLDGLDGLRSLQKGHLHQLLSLARLQVLLAGRHRHPLIFIDIF